MLWRLLVLFGLVLAAAAAASWLAQQPGDMRIDWLGWRVQLPTSLAVALVVAFALLLVFFDRILRAIRTLPGWLGGRFRQRRDAAGHRALTLGLMAVSAGEPEAARKQASRAQRLLDAPQLTGLLAAQAAHLAGDHQAARRYFTSILDDRDTAFLGQIGLLRLALDDRDSEAAHKAATAALAINPKSELAARALLQLETDRGNWQQALPALAVLHQKLGKTPQNGAGLKIRQQQVAAHYLAARDQLDDNPASSLRELEQALKLDPGFLPAVCAIADHYLDPDTDRRANYGRAAKWLEAAFIDQPHSELLPRLQKAWKANDGQFIARLEKLLGKVKADWRTEAFRLVAAAAEQAGLDGEAARLRHEAAALAENTPADDVAATWQCDACKSVHDMWHSHCPACGQFASLLWQRPQQVTPLVRGQRV